MNVEMGPEDTRPADGETVAAVDEIDGQPHLVVADRRRDEAWIAIPAESAMALQDWE